MQCINFQSKFLLPSSVQQPFIYLLIRGGNLPLILCCARPFALSPSELEKSLNDIYFLATGIVFAYYWPTADTNGILVPCQFLASRRPVQSIVIINGFTSTEVLLTEFSSGKWKRFLQNVEFGVSKIKYYYSLQRTFVFHKSTFQYYSTRTKILGLIEKLLYI